MNNKNIAPIDGQREFVTMRELLEEPQEDLQTLIDPLFPSSGLVALVGSSDSGKSALLRELAASVVSGRRFLFWHTAPKHRRVIYLSTEDEEFAMRTLTSRQNKGWKLSAKEAEGLEFLFVGENFVEKIEARLREKPADCVIVDSFGDVCQGDLSQSNVIRGILNSFSNLARRYDCLIIFLHHTRKSVEGFAPSKHNTLGSQAFEAKMRLVIELRRSREQSDKLHLCIVKGNYLSSDYKKESFDILFREDLTFETTQERTPFEEIKSPTVSKNDNVKPPSARGEKIKEQKELIVRLHKVGKNPIEISELLNIGKSSVYRCLKANSENNAS